MLNFSCTLTEKYTKKYKSTRCIGYLDWDITLLLRARAFLASKDALLFRYRVTRLLPRSLQVILALGDYMNVQCHSCIGGTSLGEDIRKLDYGQHVVSGTPGRVFGESPVRGSSRGRVRG